MCYLVLKYLRLSTYFNVKICGNNYLEETDRAASRTETTFRPDRSGFYVPASTADNCAEVQMLKRKEKK